METLKYLVDELKSINLLLKMLQSSSDRMDNGKEVPPWMLKENMELLQVFIYGAHVKMESLIFDRMENKGIDVSRSQISSDQKILRKYQKFLQTVIEAYDLGYRGAMGAFPQYCRNYIQLIENHINLVNEIIKKSEASMKNVDKELLKEMKMINGKLKRIHKKGASRMEVLMKEFSKVAA